MKKVKKIMCVVLTTAVIGGTTLFGGVYAQAKGNSESGKVSWYDQVGAKGNTASGKKAHNGAAHKTIAFNTKVKVKNNSNGKTTTVYIYDRGPYVHGRILDMDKTAFSKVEKTSAGLFNGTITW